MVSIQNARSAGAGEERSNSGGEASVVGLEIVDGYLLGDPVSKADVVLSLLAERSTETAAAPFYRALEAVGVRAADEAFIALRLVLAGRKPEDEAVRRLRALSSVARACASDDARGVAAILRRERSSLGNLADATVTEVSERKSLRGVVSDAFVAELAPGTNDERNAERDLLR